jgi:hypothetical protein
VIWASWPLEFSLELLGAFLAFRRRNWIIFSILAFLAVTDPVKLILRVSFGPSAYGWADWAQRSGEYALLCILACQLCGKLLGESWRNLVAAVSLLGALLVGLVYTGQESLPERLLDAEIAAGMLLCAVVAVGWISRSGRLKAPWNWIAAGLLVYLGSDVAITALWTFWNAGQYLYPIGSLSALALWCIGVWRPEEGRAWIKLDSLGSPKMAGATCWLDESSKAVN